MPTLFKPDRSYPLPVNSEIVTREGKHQVRCRDNGKTVYYPLTADGSKYLKPAKKWAAEVRFADGRRRRVHFSPNYDASMMMLSELLKKIENEKAGIVDRFAQHRKRVLADHINDWENSLKAGGSDPENIKLKMSRVRAALEGCKFIMPNDMNADQLESFLHNLREKEDRSIQTVNHWLQAVRQFCRWMVANERMDRDPFSVSSRVT